MSRRVAVVLSALAMLMALAGPAFSQGPPPHGHLLVTGVKYDATGAPIGFRGCRALAAGRAVPNHAHHANLHTGRAGEALWNAGNAVVPVFWGEDGTPWQNCADLKAMFPA